MAVEDHGHEDGCHAVHCGKKRRKLASRNQLRIAQRAAAFVRNL